MKHLNWALIIICILGIVVMDGVFEYVYNYFMGIPRTEFQTYAFWGCLSGLVFGILMLRFSSEEDPTDKRDAEDMNK